MWVNCDSREGHGARVWAPMLELFGLTPCLGRHLLALSLAVSGGLETSNEVADLASARAWIFDLKRDLVECRSYLVKTINTKTRRSDRSCVGMSAGVVTCELDSFLAAPSHIRAS